MNDTSQIDYFTTMIHKELVNIFDQISIPYGKGIYIKKKEESIYCTYLPYEDNVDLYFDDELVSVEEKVKVTIVSDIQFNYLKPETEIKKLFKEYDFIYENGDLDLTKSEPYLYLRTLYFNKKYFFKKEVNYE